MPEYTPAEFDAWSRDFLTYFLANRLDAQGVTIAEQRLRLSNCLGPHFKKWLNREKQLQGMLRSISLVARS